MQNGRFPESSLGNSEKQNFYNYGIKLGFLYKITGRHLLSFNGMYKTEAPYVRNAYVSPRTRDQLVPNLSSIQISYRIAKKGFNVLLVLIVNIVKQETQEMN